MRLIHLKEVKHATGLGRSMIYKYIEDGTFPKSVSLSGLGGKRSRGVGHGQD